MEIIEIFLSGLHFGCTLWIRRIGCTSKMKPVGNDTFNATRQWLMHPALVNAAASGKPKPGRGEDKSGLVVLSSVV
ncbi:MAG TPA: hypothetical protein DDW50_12715 [Firmicutes bacterium]|jgi:hypothetical protein|nr:hypothetical protein [Bacillota bacterium]